MSQKAGSLYFDTGIDGSGVESGLSALTVAAGNLIGEAVEEVVNGFQQMVQAGVNFNAQMETYVTNFTTMLNGNAEAADNLVSSLQALGAETPLAITDLTNAAQTLLAFGAAEADTMTDTLRMLGDVALGDANKLQSLSLAYGQMVSTGKLQGQDLLQMINAGFNPLQELSEMGYGTVADLKEQMSKGTISVEMVRAAFEHATSAGGKFYGAMEASSKTFSGQLSTLEDNATALIGALTEDLTAGMTDTLLPTVNEWVQHIADEAEDGGIRAATKAAGNIISNLTRSVAKNAPAFSKNFVKTIVDGIDEVNGGEVLESLLRAGLGIVEGLLEGIVEELPTAIPAMVETFFDLLSQTLLNVPRLLELGFDLLDNIVVGVVNAIPSLVSGIGDALYSLFFSSEQKVLQAVEDELYEVRAAHEEFIASVQRTDEAMALTQQEIQATQEMAIAYADIIAKLEGQDLNTQQQAELEAAVEALNNLYPDLNLLIDENTGKLNMNSEAVYASIEAYTAQAMAQSYLDAIKEKTEQIVDAQLKLSEIQNEKVIPAEDAYNKAKEEHLYWEGLYQQAIGMTGKEIAENADIFLAAGVDLSLYFETLEDGTLKLREHVDYVNLASSAQTQLAVPLKNASDELHYQTIRLGDARAEARQYTDEIADLNEQNERLAEMAQGATDKIERSAKMNETGAESFETISDSADNATREIEEYGDATEDAVEKAHGSLTAALPDFEAAADDLAKAPANALRREQEDLNDAAEAAVTEAAAASRTQLFEFDGIGYQISQGIANGVYSGSGAVSSAVSSVVNDALRAGRRTAVINSPSGLFEDELGVYIPQGAARGIKKDSWLAAQASQDMVGDMLSAAREAAASEQARYSSEGSTGAANARSAYTSSFSGSVEVVCEMDGREVARGTAPFINEQMDLL